jgi:hypothetical protein
LPGRPRNPLLDDLEPPVGEEPLVDANVMDFDIEAPATMTVPEEGEDWRPVIAPMEKEYDPFPRSKVIVDPVEEFVVPSRETDQEVPLVRPDSVNPTRYTPSIDGITRSDVEAFVVAPARSETVTLSTNEPATVGVQFRLGVFWVAHPEGRPEYA